MPNCDICRHNVPRRTKILDQKFCIKCANDFRKRREMLIHARKKINQLNRSVNQRNRELERKRKQMLAKYNRPLRFPPAAEKRIRFPQVPTHIPGKRTVFPEVPTHTPKILPKFPQVPTHAPSINKKK